MTPGTNQLCLLPTSSMEPLQHIHIRHTFACMIFYHTHSHIDTHTNSGMISQGLSPTCSADSRKQARFWGAAELFHSRQLDVEGACTSGRLHLCFLLNCKQHTQCDLAPERQVIPIAATGLPFASLCHVLRRFKWAQEMQQSGWRFCVSPCWFHFPLCENRWCSLSSGLSYSEREIPRRAGGSLEAACTCEALCWAKWCFCPYQSRSIKPLTSTVSQLNSVHQGTLISLSKWNQEVVNVIYRSA